MTPVHQDNYPPYLEHTSFPELLSRASCSNSRARYTKARASDGLDLTLPSAWNPNDKSPHLAIGGNGLDLTYTGPGRSEIHAAAARSNHPIRHQCGIYYFEMLVKAKGEDGFIGIGFCGRNNKLDRLPGWDVNSWGYHGDDGHSFEGSGTGKIYGPQFTTGDIVGCGINLVDKTAFYTKNGISLGIAFRSINTDMDLYPCVGLRTVGEQITVNFGQKPFVFDIARYVQDQKQIILKEITQTPKYTKQCNAIVDPLVVSYLVNRGYIGAAAAVARELQYIKGHNVYLSHSGLDPNDSEKEKEDMHTRQSICGAAATGDFDLAIALTEKHFGKDVFQLDLGRDVLFKLESGKFVALVKAYHEMGQHKTIGKHDARHEQMDIDQGNDSGVGFADAQDTSMISNILDYGRKLRDKYKHEPKYEKPLMEIFSLLAYQDISSSPLSYLVDTSSKHNLLDELNSAILVLQKRSAVPPLESLYRQAVVANEYLGYMGSEKASLVNIALDLNLQ